MENMGRMLVPTVCACTFLGTGLASGEEFPPDWHIGGSVVYSSRSLDGSVVNKTSLVGDAFGTLIVTGDSMNVDNSNNAMLALALQYKRFGIGLNYMPTRFKGSGHALVSVGGANVNTMVRTPLETDISVDMLLINAYYNIIQTPDSVFGIGVGFGQSSVDIGIVPEVGPAIVYDGNQPFGFLSLHMQNYYKRFLYGFSLNGISADFEGVGVVYSDYKVDLGYRLVDERTKVDIVGGYRMVNFALDLEWAGNVTATDTTLQGPFLGVKVIY